MSIIENARKRSRTENTPVKGSNFEVRFMLQITREDEISKLYSAPIGCKSVQNVKKAIREAAKIEKGWKYPNVTIQLGACLSNRIGYRNTEDEETVVDTKSITEDYFGGNKKEKVPDFSIDTKKLVTDDELDLWKETNENEVDLLEDQPSVLYQIYVMQGWG